jgi:hypothetical protein
MTCNNLFGICFPKYVFNTKNIRAIFPVVCASVKRFLGVFLIMLLKVYCFVVACYTVNWKLYIHIVIVAKENNEKRK